MTRFPPLVLFVLFFSPSPALSEERCHPDGATCAAYWVGYEYDSRSNTCEQYFTSGCSNPFSFTSREDCRLAHPDGSGFTCMVHWSGYEFDQVEGGCKAVQASGCFDPFRFHSMGECRAAHPRCGS